MAKSIVEFESSTDVWPLVDQWAKSELLFSRETSLFSKEEPDVRTYITGEAGASLASARIRISQTGNIVRLEAWKSPFPSIEQPIDSFSLFGLVNPMLLMAKGSFNRLLEKLNQPMLKKNDLRVKSANEDIKSKTGTRLDRRKMLFIGIGLLVALFLISIPAFIYQSLSKNPQKSGQNTRDFSSKPLLTIPSERKPDLAYFDPYSDSLLTLTRNPMVTKVEIWDLKTGQNKYQKAFEDSTIDSAIFHPDGHTIALISKTERRIRVIDILDASQSTGLLISTGLVGQGYFTDVQFLSNGDLVTVMSVGDLITYSSKDGSIVSENRINYCSMAAISGDGKSILCSQRGILKLLGSEKKEWDYGESAVLTIVELSSDGSLGVLFITDRMYIWNMTTGSQLKIEELPKFAASSRIQIAADNKTVVVYGNVEGTSEITSSLAFIDPEQGKVREIYTVINRPNPAINADFTRVAVRSSDGNYQIFALSPTMNK